MPTAQAGKNCYLQLVSAGVGTTLANLKASSLSINNQAVEVTNRDSNGFRELLAAAGIANASIKCEGVIYDTTAHNTLVTRALAQTIDTYWLLFGNGDKLAGDFQLTQFEAKGEFNGVQTYSFELQSSGALTATLA